MAGSLSQTVVLVLSDNPAPRLDKALAAVVPEGVVLSRSRLVKLIEEGHVRREGGAVVNSVKTKGAAGEVFEVTVPASQDYEAAEAEDIPLDVVYEDDDLIVINKPAGMVVHPAPGSETGTLVNALMHHCGDDLAGVGGDRRPGIVHRIDKDTSGLLVVAKSDAAHQGLAAQFADHSINRHYSAVCIGEPSKADPRLAGLRGVGFEDGGVVRIATNIARHKTDRKRMAVTTDSGRHAITRAAVVESFGDGTRPIAALVDCWLETGRTHQIRVHFSHIGHGLVGDPIYGRKKRVAVSGLEPAAGAVINGFTRQALHARTLGFVHPISKETVEFSAELPADMVKLIAALRR